MTDTTIVEADTTTKTPFAMWLDALRSGDYQQANGVLRDGDAFCCLGVGCDLAVKNGVIPEPMFTGARYVYGIPGEDMNGWTLPRAVQEWLGLNAPNPDITVDGYTSDVAWHNDERGLTFAQIADALEAAFPHLMKPAEQTTTTTPTV
ncbi:hypothetical protein [Micromonospora avicenniae]|uniref:hypothetical protein n=1 Tax=Micromonospora avicenniae TaxID=1198245 RepID=UPI00332A72C9